MNEISKGQQLYLKSHRKHKRIVRISRILILFSFLFLWELRLPVVFLWRAWRHGNFTGAEHVGLD